MNRFEMTRHVLLLEAAAAECRKRAATVRADLDADARAELAEHGTAPTWRLADVGTWSLPVSQEAVYVADEAALLAWVKSEPSDGLDEVVETVERIRPWYVAELLRRMRVVDGHVVDDEGTVIPGLGARPGGLPQSLRFKPNPLAQAVAADAAGDLVDQLAAGLNLGGVPGAPDAAAT